MTSTISSLFLLVVLPRTRLWEKNPNLFDKYYKGIYLNYYVCGTLLTYECYAKIRNLT